MFLNVYETNLAKTNIIWMSTLIIDDDNLYLLYVNFTNNLHYC